MPFGCKEAKKAVNKGLPLHKCYRFDPSLKRDRVAYCERVATIVGEDPTLAMSTIAIDATGRTKQFLLHHCLAYRPSLELVQSIYKGYPEAIEELCFSRLGDSVGRVLPLHIAVYHSAAVPVIEFLAKTHHAALTTRSTVMQCTPLDIALKGSSHDVVSVLSTDPVAITMPDKLGATPLFRVVKEGADPMVVATLVRACPKEAVTVRFVKVNGKNTIPVSPFVYACSYGSLELVSMIASSIPKRYHQKNNHALLSACHHGQSPFLLSELARYNPPSVANIHPTEKVSAFQKACREAYPLRTLRTLYSYFDKPALELEVPSSSPSESYHQDLGHMLGCEHEHVKAIFVPCFVPSRCLDTFFCAVAGNSCLKGLSMTEQKDDPHVCDALKLMLSENTSIERLHIENSFWQSTNLVSSLLEGLGENNGIRQLSIELDAVVSHFLPSMQAQLVEKIASNTALRRLIIAGSKAERFHALLSKHHLLALLVSQHSLTAFHLVRIRLNAGVYEIAQAIRHNRYSHLTDISLAGCLTDRSLSPLFLSAILLLLGSKALRKLNVVVNHITNDHFEVIAMYLRNDKALVRLNYQENELTAAGKKALNRLLRHHNKTLK